MVKWKKLSNTIYQCKYHIVFCPKYRYRILKDALAQFVEQTIQMLCAWKNIEILKMNVQDDHVHLILSIPPRLSVSEVMSMLKGKTAIKLFQSFPLLKKKPYWGNHFWSRGYCISTIGLDETKIRKYVQYQEDREKQEEDEQKEFGLLKPPAMWVVVYSVIFFKHGFPNRLFFDKIYKRTTSINNI